MLDEADRLFELGFAEQLDTVLAACTNPKKQCAFFSATMPQGIERLARTVLRDPIRITIGARNSATDNVTQKLVFVGKEEGKILQLRQMIQKGLKLPCLIFVQSKERATQLFREMVYDNINVEVIHSERTQKQRENIITKFRVGEIWALICTDLMSRGIDFKGVNCVINYDFPQTTVSYIHRIGRTGRAGRKGDAITFWTEQDKVLLKPIANIMRHSGCDVPDWMLKLQGPSNSQKKALADSAPQREPILPKDKHEREAAEQLKEKIRARKAKKRRREHEAKGLDPDEEEAKLEAARQAKKKKKISHRRRKKQATKQHKYGFNPGAE